MYGVVVCPRCRRAKGVRAAQRTTTCSCGFTIRVTPSGLRARVPTVSELPAAVRAVADELHGVRAEKPRRRRPSKEVHERATERALAARGRGARVLTAALALTEETVLFTRDDLAAVLERLGMAGVDDALDHLRRENLLVEPRPGYYRCLTP